jgi:magnesium chelatase family protein
VWRYRRRVSGPLLDRVDLRVELVQPRADELLRAESGEVSGAHLWDDVQRAYTRMKARQGERTNAALPAEDLADEATLEPEARRLLERVTERQSLSARAVQSVRRVARSLADLDDGADVAERHVAEAVALRAPVR